MVSKEVSCTISQFICDDILDSFEMKGVFSQLSGLSLAASPRILFLCRFPSTPPVLAAISLLLEKMNIATFARLLLEINQ